MRYPVENVDPSATFQVADQLSPLTDAEGSQSELRRLTGEFSRMLGLKLSSWIHSFCSEVCRANASRHGGIKTSMGIDVF